jgi:ankyrin repeat protein
MQRMIFIVTKQVDSLNMANDEGITALHNAVCAGHFDIVSYLVELGSDVNAADADGWLVETSFFTVCC